MEEGVVESVEFVEEGHGFVVGPVCKVEDSDEEFGANDRCILIIEYMKGLSVELVRCRRLRALITNQIKRCPIGLEQRRRPETARLNRDRCCAE